ncbi:MAG TPA: hypothetical protein VEF04_16900 [Blastocatellia bacterium]|nr:hypothetical protein [Blastocatellia bacterium]
MQYKIEPRRTHQRLEMKLQVRVTCRETHSREWVENTETLDVTPLGARFTIDHRVELGQLLHITMNMPVQLRLYDQQAQEYRTWAIVRFVKLQKFFIGGKTLTQQEVGVAFIGKTPPASYIIDPGKRYELAPPTVKGGMWNAQEVEEVQEVIQPLHSAIELLIEVLDANGNVTDREETLSRNINRNGALVATTLTLHVGTTIRLTSASHNASVKGIVRETHTDEFGINRVRVDFIDSQWPVSG